MGELMGRKRKRKSARRSIESASSGQEAVVLEYNILKEEIFVLMQRCDNLIVTMYTISITLLGVGLELDNENCYFLIILFLLPMQGLINVRRFHMARCSVYIEMCLEPRMPGLQWEKTVAQIDLKFKQSYLKNRWASKWALLLIGVGTILIAFVSLLFYFEGLYSKSGLSFVNICGMVCACILFLMLCVLTRDYLQYEKIKEQYKEIIQDIGKRI